MAAPKEAPYIVPGKRLSTLGMIGMLLIVAAAMAVISWCALVQADRALVDETARKANGVAHSLAGTFERAAQVGIPLRAMPGIAASLEEVRARHVELARISVVVGGVPMYEARTAESKRSAPLLVQTIPIPLATGGHEQLEVAVDPRFIQRLFSELALDFVVILVVAVFIMIELIYLLTGELVVSPLRAFCQSTVALANGRLGAGIPVDYPGALRNLALTFRQRQARLMADFSASRNRLSALLATHRRNGRGRENNGDVRADVRALRQIRSRFGLARSAPHALPFDNASALGSMRAPFFLLLLAEDLSRGFLPMYARDMDLGGIAISENAVVGLPIFLFMFIVAVSQPALGAWSERCGRRNAFMIGAGIAVAAHLLSAQATSLAGLLTWRAGAGISWAIAFVAAQSMVLDYTDKSSRAKGLASFVTVILVSLACGPAVGGVLADGIGYRATFLVAALLAGGALMVAWRTLPRHRSDMQAAQSARRVATIGELPLHPLKNWRFLGLLLLAAVPAKLILVAFFYYLMPLYLTSAGYSATMAGRVIMIYSVIMIVLVPISGDFFDRLRRQYRIAPHAWFVGFGIAFSGLASIAMMVPNEITAATLLAGMLGAAQAISISAQAAMVPELTRAEIAKHGEAVVYGYYRLVERIGSALGPIVAATMLQLFSFRLSFIVLGMIVFACGVLFALLYARTSQLRPSVEANP